MTQHRATFEDARAVTPEQLTSMTPPQIDALNAVVGEEGARIEKRLDSAFNALQRALGERMVYRGRRQVWPLTSDEAESKARTALDEDSGTPEYRNDLQRALHHIEDARGRRCALHDGPAAALDAEWHRRGGWPRFFLVQNSNGHIHKTNSPGQCHTLHHSTLLAWLPDLSGLSEKDAVDAHGPLLCSVCFPSAPVEWTVGKPKAASDECPGSRKPLEPTNPRAMSKYGKCPECGETVSITPSWKARAHKRPKDQS